MDKRNEVEGKVRSGSERSTILALWVVKKMAETATAVNKSILLVKKRVWIL